MNYCDICVLPLKKDQLKDYLKLARKVGKLWKKYGAISYKEFLSDDLDSENTQNSFPKFLKLRNDEIFFCSTIEFKSRKHRNEVNAKVMSDPIMKGVCENKNVPFDMERMLYAGFEERVDI